MNMFKKNGGFTLVELIVVIAILAILAGIAVPAYSGYMKSAQEAGDITALTALKTAAVAAMATEGEVVDMSVETDDNGAIAKITVNTAYTVDKYPTDYPDADLADQLNPNTVATVIFSTTEADVANTDPAIVADFKAYAGTMPTLKFFTTGAAWDAKMDDAKTVPTEDEAINTWKDNFADGKWGQLTEFQKLYPADKTP